MSEFFNIFLLIHPEWVINIVVCGIGALLFCGWIGWLPRSIAPQLMISLGICGTFWGVYIALAPLDFSPEKINDSIQALLVGMKAAFLTSLLGLIAGIGTRFGFSLLDEKTRRREKSYSPEHKDIAERLEAIKKAIAGDDWNGSVNVPTLVKGFFAF